MLRQITGCRDLEARRDQLLMAGAVVNGLPSPLELEREARRGSLWAGSFSEGLLILRKRRGFSRLNFMLAKGAELPPWTPEGCVAVETPFRPQDQELQRIDRALGERGFRLALSRARLTRRPGGPVPRPGDQVFRAGPEQLERAEELLEAGFSPLTGCLPQREELLEDLEQGRIFMSPWGILHFSERGNVTEVRHLAVAAERRGMGQAKGLLAAYLSEYGGKTARVWTGGDNAPALGLYHSFGYQEDPWRSHVRVWGQYGEFGKEDGVCGNNYCSC